MFDFGLLHFRIVEHFTNLKEDSNRYGLSCNQSITWKFISTKIEENIIASLMDVIYTNCKTYIEMLLLMYNSY